MEITLITDGSSRGNPGPGGWAAILVRGKATKELSGGEAHTTNNRMEIMGLLEGLSILTKPCDVHVISDSRYVIDSVQKRWVYGWAKRGWIKSDGKPALNADLWKLVIVQLERHNVRFTWVRGHTGHPLNERADALACAQSAKLSPRTARRRR
jgi:ribonuclease HI